VKNNPQTESTQKLTNRKPRIQKNEGSLQTSYTAVSQYRQKSGASFEKEMKSRLLANGIPTEKKSIEVEFGLVKMSDHYYAGRKKKYWIESTTCLTTQARVDELLNKKRVVQAEDPTITDWVIFFRKNPRQKEQSKTQLAKFRKQFEMNGYTFCNGDEEINKYIEFIIQTESINRSRIINVAMAMMIPLSKIKFNVNNREIPDQNVQVLKDSIVQDGFVTQINVIPVYENGKPTGEYEAFEGHTRLRALLELLNEGHKFKTGDDPLIPCVVCDWLTSEDKETVARLLCRTNTTSRPWEMKNYIIFHHKTSAPTYVNNQQKHYSYGVLKWLRTTEARMTLVSKNGTPVLFGENLLIYIFGPKKSDKTASKFLSTSIINEGDYRTDETEFKMIKKFLNTVLLPFHEWFTTAEYFDNKTLRRFMSTLYEWYKSGKYSINEIKFFTEYFKNMNRPPVKESEISDSFWNELEDAYTTYVSMKKKTRSKSYIANPV
jgi:hypothetical protein